MVSSGGGRAMVSSAKSRSSMIKRFAWEAKCLDEETIRNTRHVYSQERNKHNPLFISKLVRPNSYSCLYLPFKRFSWPLMAVAPCCRKVREFTPRHLAPRHVEVLTKQKTLQNPPNFPSLHNVSGSSTQAPNESAEAVGL